MSKTRRRQAKAALRPGRKARPSSDGVVSPKAGEPRPADDNIQRRVLDIINELRDSDPQKTRIIKG